MGYLLGIDGGGTKTTVVLADRRGHVLACSVGGPGNYLKVGLPAVRRSFAEAIGHVLKMAGVGNGAPIDGVCAGLAGADRPRDRKIIRALLAGLINTRRIMVENDARITLIGACRGRPGVIVIAGTGSVALGMNAAGKLVRAGGWGHVLGDEGSGYDIGRRAMMAALQSHDGRGRKTLLELMVVKSLRLKKLEDLVTYVYSRGMPPDEVAAFYSLVVEAARRGDAVAAHLLGKAGQDLGQAACAVVEQLRLNDKRPIVAVSGGVFKVRGILYRAFCACLRKAAPQSQIIEPKHPPEIGALALLRARLDRTPVTETFNADQAPDSINS
ncbi:MAG: hypothetical protein HYR55_00625 [Acidobacteria bacterium]|nr:hypothetical protein [Acidobacteriota bacterium]MBI3655290.1 hypothetical protein [Acidobacteriota bacterium]